MRQWQTTSLIAGNLPASDAVSGPGMPPRRHLGGWTQESECASESAGSDASEGCNRRSTRSRHLYTSSSTQRRPMRRVLQVRRRDATDAGIRASSTRRTTQLAFFIRQKDYWAPSLTPLILRDEAHRTTGAKFEGEDETHFVRVHDADYIRGRNGFISDGYAEVIFGDNAKATEPRAGKRRALLPEEWMMRA